MAEVTQIDILKKQKLLKSKLFGANVVYNAKEGAIGVFYKGTCIAAVTNRTPLEELVTDVTRMQYSMLAICEDKKEHAQLFNHFFCDNETD